MKKVISIVFAVMLIALSALPAFAVEVDSPISEFEYGVTVVPYPSNGGNGTYEFTTEIDEDGFQVVHLVSKPNEGFKFDHWEIEGEYTTDNKLTDAEIDVVISGDIIVKPYFVSLTPDETPTTVVNKDTTPTSPKTGYDNTALYAILVFAAAACGFAAFKLAKSR